MNELPGEVLTSEILTLAAIVASFVGILKVYGVPSKHNHLFALIVAAIFILVPERVQQTLIMISLVGLTASGAYHYSKTPKSGDDKQQ
ncbi:hypothetical protein DQG23_35165 [Paenibacillus contaminans]|uniref:Holin n=2 Tax=Paenibacillus contaminans TaxID=450362 RepID=A0A329M0P3_9BACL|nr:hypothetical protein DQG23_35165 [Paenibacillus contaminans]